MPSVRLTGGRCALSGLVLLGAAALACAATVGPPIVGLSHSGPRVLAAVKAGYPELCSEWRDELVAHPNPASWYTSWDVECISGYTGSVYPVMTVNLVTCQWHEPLDWSWDWHATRVFWGLPCHTSRCGTERRFA